MATTTWKVGGNTYANIRDVVPSTAYQNEVVNPVTANTTDNKTEYTAQIGLVYASDYGFAAEPSAWTKKLYNYNSSSITIVNWMYMGLNEWTISRDASSSDIAFSLIYSGYLFGQYVYNYRGVRPSFNLLSSVTYVSGSGTSSDPIRIN